MAVTARQVFVGIILTLLMCCARGGSAAGLDRRTDLDAGGLPLPGATVTVTEQNTGFTRTVVTAETGAYSVPNLEPGLYTITVEMSGFASHQAGRSAAHVRLEHPARRQDAGRRRAGRGHRHRPVTAD